MGGPKNTSIETISSSPRRPTVELLAMKSSSNHRFRSTDNNNMRQDHRPNLIQKTGQRQLQQPHHHHYQQQQQLEQMTSADRSKPSLGKRRDSFNSSLSLDQKMSSEPQSTKQPIPDSSHLTELESSSRQRLPRVLSGAHLPATCNSTDLSSSADRSSMDNADVTGSGGKTAGDFVVTMGPTGLELVSDRDQDVALASERRWDDSKEVRFPPIPLRLSNHEIGENGKANDEYVSDDDVISVGETPRHIEITTITLIGTKSKAMRRSATTGSVKQLSSVISGPSLPTRNSFSTLPIRSRTQAKRALHSRKQSTFSVHENRDPEREVEEDAIVIGGSNSQRPVGLRRPSNGSTLNAVKFGSTRLTARRPGAGTVRNDGNSADEYPSNSLCDSPTTRRIMSWLIEVDQSGPADRPPTAVIFDDEPTQTDTAIHIVYDGD